MHIALLPPLNYIARAKRHLSRPFLASLTLSFLHSSYLNFFPVPLLNVVQTFFLCNLIHPIFPSPCPQALLMLSLLRLCLLSNPCFLLYITPTSRSPPNHFLPPTASLSVDAKVPLTFNATLAFMSFLSPTLITIRSQSSCCISAFVRMASFAPYWRSVLQSNFEIALAFALSFPPTGGVLALCASYLPYLWYKKCSNLLLKLFITILSN